MKEVIDAFTHPVREKISQNDIEGFHIGTSAYVVKKNGVLYRLIGDTAMEFVKAVL